MAILCVTITVIKMTLIYTTFTLKTGIAIILYFGGNSRCVTKKIASSDMAEAFL
jgi:hypothetical protein